MSIYEGRRNNYDDLVKEGIVIVDFYSERCVPCKMFSMVLEKIHYQLPFLNIVKVNSSKYPEISQENKVGCFPTVLFLKDGEELDRHLGFMDVDTVIRKLRQIIK